MKLENVLDHIKFIVLMTCFLDPYWSINYSKAKDLNWTRSDVLSPKDEATQALKVEIKYCIEKRNVDSNPKLTES